MCVTLTTTTSHQKRKYSKGIIRSKSIVLTALLTTLGSVSANEFWANPLGGGPDDVLINRLVLDDYQMRSNSDYVEADVDENGNVFFDIKADSEAVVVIPGLDSGTAAVSDPNGVGRLAAPLVGEQSATDVDLNDGLTVAAGRWTVEIPTPSAQVSRLAVEENSDLSLKNLPIARVDLMESPFSLAVEMREDTTSKGIRTVVSARMTDNTGVEIPNESISSTAHQIQNPKVFASISYEGGQTVTQRLADNGRGRFGDEFKKDNIFSFKHHFKKTGSHTVVVTLEGLINDALISRTAVLHVIVGENRVATRSRTVTATTGDILNIPIESSRVGLPVVTQLKKGNMPEFVDSRAEVWAKDNNGQDVVVGWIGGVVKPVFKGSDKWAIPFSFHTGWLEKGDFKPPFSLKSVELFDQDTGEQIVYNDKTIVIKNMPAVSKLEVRSKSAAFIGDTSNQPSVEMTQGAHPSTFSSNKEFAAAPAQLAAKNIAPINPALINTSRPMVLSLHGWCSAAKTADGFSFNIRIKAQEFEGSTDGRSANKYANDVAQWLRYTPGSIRGIVAHSQGGLVAATLLQNYPYLFADNAMSRPVNVISMSSPYNGSSLFRVRNGWSLNALAHTYLIQKAISPSCNPSYDLLPSMNHRWRNLIQSRARSQVESWVTVHSKRQGWWEGNLNRNCGPSTALIPHYDDGAINYYDPGGFATGGMGQVPSRYGWCHTGKFGKRNQWSHPDFVSRVNSVFHTDLESWQPY